MTKTILIVDDDRTFAEIASNIMEDNGFACVIAGSAHEADERLKTETPDAILLDLVMPDMDGRDFLRRLKADPRTRAIPVVMCSVSHEADLQDQVVGLGGSGFIHKTKYLKELAPRLRKVLE